MKDLINARKLKNHVSNLSCDASCDVWGVEEKYIDKAKRVNAVVIPKGATNLDMLKAVFPNIEIAYSKYDVEGTPHIVMVRGLDGVTSLTADWANAPYEMEEPETIMEEERE